MHLNRVHISWWGAVCLLFFLKKNIQKNIHFQFHLLVGYEIPFHFLALIKSHADTLQATVAYFFLFLLVHGKVFM